MVSCSHAYFCLFTGILGCEFFTLIDWNANYSIETHNIQPAWDDETTVKFHYKAVKTQFAINNAIFELVIDFTTIYKVTS